MKRSVATLISLTVGLTFGAAQAVVNFELPAVLQPIMDYEAYQAIQAVDLDGDARPDLVVRSESDGIASHHVRLNRGASGFAPGADLPGDTPTFVDLDADGVLDVVRIKRFRESNNSLISMIAYSRGRGDGTFTASNDLDFPNSRPDPVLQVGDLDADGDADVVVAGYSNYRAFRNDGGTLVPLPVGTLTLPTLGTYPAGFAHIDTDGQLDIVFDNLTWRAGLGDGSFATTSRYVIGAGDTPDATLSDARAVRNADISAPGANDLIVISARLDERFGSRASTLIGILRRAPDGSLLRAGVLDGFDEYYPNDPVPTVRLVDLDDDGRDDIVVSRATYPCTGAIECAPATEPPDAFSMLRVTTDGELTLGPGFGGGTFAFADVDGDGRLDAIGMSYRTAVFRRNLDAANQRPLSPATLQMRVAEGYRALESPLFIPASDPDQNVLDYRVITAPSRSGAEAFCRGPICYYGTGYAGGGGTDSFTVQISDRAGGTTTTLVEVTISGAGSSGGGAPDLLWLGALAVLGLWSVRRRAARA